MTATPDIETLRQALKKGRPTLKLARTSLILASSTGFEYADGQLEIDMTMTSPACPMGDLIIDDIHAELERLLPAEIEVKLTVVWDPPWQPSMMSPECRGRLGWRMPDKSRTPSSAMNTARPRSTGYRRLPCCFRHAVAVWRSRSRTRPPRLGRCRHLPPQAAGLHGPLMIGAFSGRSSALNGRSPSAPAGPTARWLPAAGWLLWRPARARAGTWLRWAPGTDRRQRRGLAPANGTAPAILTLAAVCWLAGNAVWISTGNPAQATPWWLLFSS